VTDDYDVKAAREEWKRKREAYQRRNESKPSWQEELLMPEPKTPRPLPVVENAMVVLANEPELKDLFGYDEMACTEVVVRSAPQPLTDIDITETQCFLQRFGLRRIGHQTTRDAIERYARTKPFHPLRDYLQGLSWDMVPRLGTWTTRYLGVAETSYSNTVGELFLISMIARVLDPGCKADHMVILEGPQGTYKSMACGVLGGEYFSDNLPDLSDAKDVSIHLRGKWLIEISEMHTFSRAEAEHLKAFLAQTHERFRPVYGRKDVIEPRQCVFVGTSNKDAYLKDETGGRRFWPLVCGTIDIESLRTDREQLLAEAVVAFLAGRPWWPSPAFEAEHIQPEQERRYEIDEWSSIAAPYVGPLMTVTTAQVAEGALGLKPDRLGLPEQRRIAAIMRRLGWTLKHTKTGNVWIRPATTH
jgi:predicted P-loop ATPase